MKIIIYPKENNSIVAVYPTGEIPVEEVARKDIPAGVPYLIIEDTDMPEENEFFEAFEADFSSPHGHGADYGVGTNLAVVEYVNGIATRVRDENTGEVSFTTYGNQLVSEGIYDNNQP